MQVTAAEPDWESPFKKIKPDTKVRAKPTANPTRLFTDEEEAQPKPRTLSELYNFNLDRPPLIDKDRQFFAVRNLVEDIENILEMQPDHRMAALWRTRVSQQLSVTNFDKKMAELGAILFYISKDEYNLARLEITPSLMQYRAIELQQEVMRYIAAGSQIPIPSGKIHYLMRAFAHMVVTKNHVYNRGGLIAVRELLTNPQYQLAQYLQPEHREHILVIITHLLSKPSTPSLFSTPVTVHESLKDLIRIDLKLDSQSPVDSPLVLYDCLMALFADVRQRDYPNCYAIAAFSYSTQNNTTKILYKMLDWLKTGYYSFDNKISIPIRPLLEGRLVSFKDLSVTVNPDSLITSAPIGHIQSTLGLKAPRKSNPSPQPLDQALRTLLPDNSKKDDWSYMTKLYNGFKYNALVSMHIALLEFENSNLSGTNEVKEQLIWACLNAVKNAAKLSEDKLEELGNLLDAKLWLHPCYEKKVVMKDGTIQVGSVEVIPFAGNDRALVDLLNSSIRLFTLKDDQFHPVYSISDLRAAVTAAMRALGISAQLNANVFANQISEVCGDQLRRYSYNVTAKSLKAYDLLVFCQNGGYGNVVIDRVYQISAKKEQITDAATAYAFLEKLFNLFKTSTLKRSQETPKLLIHTYNTDSHQWTVNAKCWRVFSTCRQFYPFIQQNVFKPANQRLESRISQDVFICIILRYTKNQSTIDKLMASFRSLDQPTYRDVLQLLRSATPLADERAMRAIVDEEFSKVSINKSLISRVLRAVDIIVTTPTFEKIYDGLTEAKTLPFLLARDIRLGLIKNKTAVVDPYDIEVEISKAASLPLSINIGDTNWTDDHTEDPSHITLWSRYSYWDNTLGYFIRKNLSEIREPSRNFRNIVIHHPHP